MPKVVVKMNDTIESLLRRFKRSVEKSGVLSKVRRCQFYEKPSAERKRKKAAAVKRHLKKVARENMYASRGPSLPKTTSRDFKPARTSQAAPRESKSE